MWCSWAQPIGRADRQMAARLSCYSSVGAGHLSAAHLKRWAFLRCSQMTEKDDCTICGECDPWPTKEGMASLLNASGIQANFGAYSVRLLECCGITFECYGGDLGNPQIQAHPASAEELINAANRVSRALSAAGVRHRFEIYNATEKLVGYVHHKWPQGA